MPIYNAHGNSNFMFRAADMEQLTQLPLYRAGLADPPANTVVTVGYAVNEYKYTANTSLLGNPIASLNILFVVVIGDLDRQLLDDLSAQMTPSA